MSTSAEIFRRLLGVEPSSTAVAWGHLILRIGFGLMIFYIHGWHKLHDGLAYLNTGKPWKLAEEVAQMGFPLPLLSAFAATAVQLFCSLMLIPGLFTRVNVFLLAGTLSVAILQNVLAHRDPELAVLYTLALVTMGFLGGGRYSLDARFFSEDTLPTSRVHRPKPAI